jgi:hypothetical protein
MEMTPQDCGLDDGPVDPDLAWTRWALGSLGELVEIGLRSARMTATEQMATPITRTKPDFALAQVRLARSVRLSIAMSQRVRENYQDRRDGKAQPMPAEEASEVAAAEAAPAEAVSEAGPKDSEPRPEPRESLTESERLETELEPAEEPEERRELDAALLPRDWDGAAAAETSDCLPEDLWPDTPAETVPMAARPEHDWPRPLDESDPSRPAPKPWKPDSS